MLIGLSGTIVAPAGQVQFTDVALAGMLANVYVYFLPPASPQTAVWITSITPGVAGLSLLINSVLGPLVPQPFVAVTDTDPDIKPAGYINDIVLVPWPVKLVKPAGGVQV